MSSRLRIGILSAVGLCALFGGHLYWSTAGGTATANALVGREEPTEGLLGQRGQPAASGGVAGNPVGYGESVSLLKRGESAAGESKLLQWQRDFGQKCGGEIDVSAMVGEARQVMHQIDRLASTVKARGLTSRQRKREQRDVIEGLIRRWCLERAPHARTERCIEAFVFCEPDGA